MKNKFWLTVALSISVFIVNTPSNASEIRNTERIIEELLQQTSPPPSTIETHQQKIGKAGEFIASKKYRQAISLLEELRQSSSQDKQVCYFLSLSHIGLQQWDKANTTIDECIAIDNRWVEAFTLKATILAALKQYPQAEQYYNRIIKFKPNSPGSYLQRAKFYYFYMRDDHRALQQALSDMEQFVRLGGPEENVHALSGMIYASLNRLKEAKDQLTKAIDYQPENLRVVAALIKIYHREKRYNDAGILLENTDKHLDKSNIEQHSQYFLLSAQHAIASEDVDKIEGYFKQALNIHPENYTARKEYIYWLDKQERLEETIAISKQGLAYVPEDPYFTSFLAWAYADGGKDVQQANIWIDKAKALSPNNVYLSDTHAWLAVRQGNYSEALKRISPSLPYVDQVPEIAYHMGVIHYHLGDEKKAIDYLRQALQNKGPFNGKTQAKKLLTQLIEKKS